MTLKTSMTRLSDLNLERISNADVNSISLAFNLERDSDFLNSRNM